MNRTIKDFLKKHFTSLAFFYRYLRYRMVLLFGVSVFVGVMDGFGLTMFIPLLESIAGDSNTAEGMGKLAFIVNGLEALGWELTLTTVLLVMLFFFSMKGIAKFVEGYLSTIYRQYFVRRLRIDSIRALANYQYTAFISADAGRIQNTLSTEMQRVMSAYWNYTRMMQTTMLVLTYMTLAFLANAEFAILVLIAGGITNLLFNTFYRQTKRYSGELVYSNRAFQGLLIQLVAFFKYLKASGTIRHYQKYLESKVEELETTQKKIGILNAFMMGLREPLIVAVVVAVILFQVNVLGGSLSAILISLVLFYRAMVAVTQLQNSYNSFLGFSGSLSEADSFLTELQSQKEVNRGRIFPGFKDQLVVENVSFNYGSNLVLRDISFSIPRNETIALVGESGSGKTTLMNIITGLLQPSKGRVLADGIDLREYNLHSYRNRIGYITQEPVIFDDTVFNNVSLWADPTENNRQLCWEALEKANIKTVVSRLPAQLNSQLGMNGVTLSGGQKQRISIARELFKDIDFLFMDEATSSLDTETEQIVQQNIKSLKGKYTIILISHKINTIKYADKIYLIDNNNHILVGTYNELITKSEYFKRLAEVHI